MKTKILFLLLCFAVSAGAASGQKSDKKSKKNIKISGYVVDGTQKPVANAIVLVDEEKTGYLTDARGFYKLKVKSDAQKIGIFTTTNGIREELIDGKTRINFTFEGSVPDQIRVEAKSPGDEEVNIGYQTVKKRNVTGTVSNLDGSNSKYGSYRTIYDMIRGELPGVQVVGNSIKINGASSLTLSTEPLFVVDGVTVSSVDNIQPAMVKSIQVLKGSSASIYGSRGGNGVILINLINSSDQMK